MYAIKNAYEICPACKGVGLQDGIDGPVMCYECKGECTVRLRDDKGRFTSKVEYVEVK